MEVLELKSTISEINYSLKVITIRIEIIEEIIHKQT